MTAVQMDMQQSATTVYDQALALIANLGAEPEPVEPTPVLPWDEWLAEHFADYTTSAFAVRHRRFWAWISDLERGVRPRARVEVWPRGGAKSTTVELGCAYIGSQPNPVRHYVLYVSETQAQADKHVQAIAGMLEAVGIGRAVNQYGSSKGWRRTELRTANGFNVTAFGLDSALRGIKLDKFRPDLIVMDDIDNRHDTAHMTTKKIESITTSILPAGTSDTAVIIVQNKIAKNSIVSQLCDGRADFLHDRIPAVVEPAVHGLEYDRTVQPDGSVKYRITGGVATWEGQNLTTCEQQINEWGEEAFLREAQHEVAGSDNPVFHREWFGTVREGEHYLAIIQSWDTAFKTADRNDYSACVTIGITATGYDVLHVWRQRVEYPDLERAAEDQAAWVEARYPGVPLTILIEDKASGQSLLQSLRKRTRRPVIPVPASRADEKLQRANEVAPTVEAGRVRVPAVAHWREPFLTEIAEFPDGTHDDQVDGFTIGLRRAAGVGQDGGQEMEVENYWQRPEAQPDTARWRRPSPRPQSRRN